MCPQPTDVSNKRRVWTHLLLFAAMILGLVTGWTNVPFLNSIATGTSTIFLRLLKLISLPIIFLAVTSTITGMKDLYEMRTMGRRVFTYTFLTTIIAAIIALILYVLIKPAQRNVGNLVSATSSAEVHHTGSYLPFLLNIVPSNFVQAFAENNVMGIVFTAILLSISILFLPAEQKSFLNRLFSGLFAAMIKMTTLIITLMPIAIWAFMTLLMKDLRQNYTHLRQLILYLTCVVGANLLQGLVVLPLMLKFKQISPLKTAKGLFHALVVAFFTKSSNATLPVAMEAVEKNLGVSNRVSHFTLPLCSVINMNGCAAFIFTTVLFVSSINGMSFGIGDLIGWVFLATFAAIGNAGVPMGCFFLTSAFLIGMDIPLFLMGLILPFYTLLDMLETTLNIWSDGCITVAVNKDLNPVSLPLPAASK